ncbi:PilZ domain-containing protein [Telmatobacter bradus]|uniref:PilZ domain-containing protein n=1 Tax=Telmatobacter bradus TaxID=474953 RepID=UPI003B434500
MRYEPAPGGIERRKDFRHEIQQDAQISFVSTSVTMNCWLIEISMGGARIYTEQAINYAVGTACELRFVKYGQSYLLPAHIQVKNNDQLAGLQFEELSQRIQQRLIEFIKEL